MCAYLGVAVGTGVGASWRRSGLGCAVLSFSFFFWLCFLFLVSVFC